MRSQWLGCFTKCTEVTVLGWWHTRRLWRMRKHSGYKGNHKPITNLTTSVSAQDGVALPAWGTRSYRWTRHCPHRGALGVSRTSTQGTPFTLINPEVKTQNQDRYISSWRSWLGKLALNNTNFSPESILVFKILAKLCSDAQRFPPKVSPTIWTF